MPFMHYTIALQMRKPRPFELTFIYRL